MYQCMELDIVCKLIRTILGKQLNQLFTCIHISFDSSCNRPRYTQNNTQTRWWPPSRCTLGWWSRRRTGNRWGGSNRRSSGHVTNGRSYCRSRRYLLNIITIMFILWFLKKNLKKLMKLEIDYILG